MSDESHNSAPEKPPFPWNPKKEEAALLLAKDELTDLQISEKLGIGRRTLSDWKERPEFCRRIDTLQSEIRDRIRRHGIAVVENRVSALGDRLRRMQQVIIERGADPKMQEVPGGRTGLLVHNVKSIGSGATAERVDLYEFDAALLNEMRQHEKQAAQELGQWTEKHEASGSMTLYTKTVKGVSQDDL